MKLARIAATALVFLAPVYAFDDVLTPTGIPATSGLPFSALSFDTTAASSMLSALSSLISSESTAVMPYTSTPTVTASASASASAATATATNASTGTSRTPSVTVITSTSTPSASATSGARGLGVGLGSGVLAGAVVGVVAALL